ncbi:hypothetical protein [Comamonas sp. JC664]|uniref:hypothetical protein n=1 Tax=Comamonas sp. JC664 TaxID=2801917 RepID=UPI00174E5C2D|nr:hypothetical protein [Comamonas sp. JC664]MBL0696420.1 hypothetical protein [Comamonas sp. JC664]GHG84134.1 hypothetical protein GCM10012319_39440 [Comamonas sp. KCTC 72670]
MNQRATQPARKSGNPTVIRLVAVAGLVGLMGGGVMLLNGGGMGGGLHSDVGGNPELAPFQAQLQSLNACIIEYGARRGVARHRWLGSAQFASVSPCEGPSASTVVVSVPEALQSRHVAFDMKRSSRSAAWRILVDKEETSLPDLKQSLQQLAPLLVEKYPEELANAIQRRAESERKQHEYKDAERSRKEAAKNSYTE